MNSQEISARLHDILRAACRVRASGPGHTAEAIIESIDQVKAHLRALIADLGDQEAPRLPPRLQANAADFPEGRIPGTRAVVRHRRRTRGPTPSPVRPMKDSPARTPAAQSETIRLPDPYAAAEALFRRPPVRIELLRAAGFRR